MAIGSVFKPIGSKLRKLPLPDKPKGGTIRIRRSLNYERIKAEVMEAIAKLPGNKQAKIPMMGTLPEIMVALALVWLDLSFQWQRSESGGRLRIGGSVVDFVVFFGATKVLIRAQGSYWHSLPERKRSDAIQAARLRSQGYRIFDAWENDLYQAWVDGRLKRFVEQGLMNAA